MNGPLAGSLDEIRCGGSLLHRIATIRAGRHALATPCIRSESQPRCSWRNHREHDRHGQDDAEAQAAAAERRAETGASRSGCRSSPSRNAIRLAMLPCRHDRPLLVQPVRARDVRQGIGEDPDPDRAERRLPTGAPAPASRSLSRSVWGGQSGRSQETTLLPKTSAWRSNRRER